LISLGVSDYYFGVGIVVFVCLDSFEVLWASVIFSVTFSVVGMLGIFCSYTLGLLGFCSTGSGVIFSADYYMSFGALGVCSLIFGVPNVYYTLDFLLLGVFDVYATYFGLFCIYLTSF
jgi:hypothetical protein